MKVAGDIVTAPLLAAVPGLIHGFTTRGLGSMAGSLFPRGAQAANRARLSSALALPLVKVSQVHSADVALLEGGVVTRLRDGSREAASDATPLEADALITRDRAVALTVAVADCVPVLVVADGWLALAHAGWQGTMLGVVDALCVALAERGVDLASARAAVGPSIGPCCYGIDRQRAALVRARLGADDLHDRGDAVAFDLWAANRRQLARHGVREVELLGVCTRDAVSRFFSQRGEHGQAGRGLAFVGWRA